MAEATIQLRKLYCRRRGVALLKNLLRDWHSTTRRRYVNKILICTSRYFPGPNHERIKMVLREMVLAGGDWNQVKNSLKRTGHSRKWIETVCEWGDKLKAQ